jgi:hypothetical protein
MGLRVKIDHQCAKTLASQRGGHIHGGCRLANPTLLIQYCDAPHSRVASVPICRFFQAIDSAHSGNSLACNGCIGFFHKES